jgi:hypothetical protein
MRTCISIFIFTRLKGGCQEKNPHAKLDIEIGMTLVSPSLALFVFEALGITMGRIYQRKDSSRDRNCAFYFREENISHLWCGL